MGHKDFELAVVDEALSGPTFTIAGRKFGCIQRVPAGMIRDVIVARDGNLWSIAGMIDFVRGCIQDSDEATWDELIHDKSIQISTDSVAEIFEFLVQEYLGRPSMPPSGSPDGRP